MRKCILCRENGGLVGPGLCFSKVWGKEREKTPRREGKGASETDRKKTKGATETECGSTRGQERPGVKRGKGRKNEWQRSDYEWEKVRMQERTLSRSDSREFCVELY